MTELYDEMVKRNIGIITEEDQEIIKNACVGIGGVGGVGGHLAHHLVRMGIGKLKISDPEQFDLSNRNRQFGSTVETVDEHKVDVVKRCLLEINPDLEIEAHYGLGTHSIEEFVCGCDFVSDSVEIFYLDLKIQLYQQARKQGIPVSCAPAIGFGSALFVFDPDGMTFEEFYGIDENPDDPIKWRNPIHAIKPGQLSYFPEETWDLVATKKMNTPTLSPSVDLSGITSTTAVMKYLLKKGTIDYVPHVRHIDLMDNLNHVVDFSK